MRNNDVSIKLTELSFVSLSANHFIEQSNKWLKEHNISVKGVSVDDFIAFVQKETKDKSKYLFFSIRKTELNNRINKYKILHRRKTILTFL